MVNVNFQTYGKGFNLRLRLYQDGIVRYLCVNKLLRGKLLKKHWNAKKQAFIKSAPFSEENNKALSAFRKKYDDLAFGWEGDLISFMLAVNGEKAVGKVQVSSEPTIHELIQTIVAELKRDNKHSDGTLKGTYEVYEKTERRLQEFCSYIHSDYDKLRIKDVNSTFINALFDWIKTEKSGRGFVYISKTLHAMLVKAEQRDWFDMQKIKHIKWAKKTSVSSQKYRTLTTAQCKRLSALTYQELPNAVHKILYRDFCIFLLNTGQSPCDAISLRQSDIRVINGIRHFIFKRRKISEKQVVPCAVPITEEMEKIIKRWEPIAKDGYIFPIRNKERMKNLKTNNGDIKKFISCFNIWLKKLGKLLGCDFPLHSYTFRHTAITRYLSEKVPAIYVSNMMGTSIKNCEQIYYNNQGDKISMNMILELGKI